MSILVEKVVKGLAFIDKINQIIIVINQIGADSSEKIGSRFSIISPLLWEKFLVGALEIEQNCPLEGKLLAYSVSRNAVYQAWSRIKMELPYITYIGQKTEKGHSIAGMTKVHFDPNEPLLILEE